MFEIIPKCKNWFVSLCLLSVNLMSFTGSIGYPWTSPFLPKLNGHADPDQNPLSEPLTLLQESWITSLHSLGALCGLLLTGLMTKKFGKKLTLILFSIPMFISNLMLIIASSVVEFYISRFLLGIGTACVFSVVPTYVAEITEVCDRGKAGMVMPLMNATAHLLVVAVGPYVTIRTFACLSLIPSVLFYFTFIPFVPESPYSYILCNKMVEAEKSLKKLRNRKDVKIELADIIRNFKETQTVGTFKEIFHSKPLRKSLIISTGLILGQQVTGCQPVTAYQQEIFLSTDGIIPSHLSVIIVGVSQLFVSMIVLAIIDKVGRKVLFLFSYIGLFSSLVSLGTYFYMKEHGYDLRQFHFLPLIFIATHMAFFRVGAGPVCWTVIGEIFPSNLKSQLSAIVTSEMVILTFITSFIYPVISWTFWTFAIMTGLFIFFIWLVVPEIKGKSFLEIQELLKK